MTARDCTTSGSRVRTNFHRIASAPSQMADVTTPTLAVSMLLVLLGAKLAYDHIPRRPEPSTPNMRLYGDLPPPMPKADADGQMHAAYYPAKPMAGTDGANPPLSSAYGDEDYGDGRFLRMVEHRYDDAHGLLVAHADDFRPPPSSHRQTATAYQYPSVVIKPASYTPSDALEPTAKPYGMSIGGTVKPRLRPASLVSSIGNELDRQASVIKHWADVSTRRVSGNGQRVVLEPHTKMMFMELERRWGEKLEIRWAYRDQSLNKKVGGVKHSMHLKGKALDIVHAGWSKDKMRRFVKLAYGIGFRGFGMGRNVIHIDSRDSLTSWNYGGNRYGLAYAMLR